MERPTAVACFPRRRWACFPSLLACLVLIAACGGKSGSTNSANANAVSGAAGSGAGPAAKWSEIFDMIVPMPTAARCVSCHGMPANDLANGNLHLGADKETAYKALVGVKSMSTRCMNKTLVDPGHPESSLMLQKLSPNPPCGMRMPIGPTYLTDAQLEMIRSWIAAGAMDN